VVVSSGRTVYDPEGLTVQPMGCRVSVSAFAHDQLSTADWPWAMPSGCAVKLTRGGWWTTTVTWSETVLPWASWAVMV